jgi:uncharacterized protein (PEP-CTERM system associated)
MQRHVAFLLGTLLLTLFAPHAVASWRGVAGVSGSLIFTDNLFLSADAEESGGIVQFRPYVSASRRGNRVDARVAYGPSVLYYPGNSELNDVQHTLDARLNTEVIERYFFIDVRALANQALVDPQVNSRFDPIGGQDAFAQQFSFTVTPRIVLPVVDNRFASVRIEPGLGYTVTASTQNDNDGLRTPTRDTSVRVVSGPMFTRVPWSINWRRRLFDADTNDGFGSVDTRVGYIFSPKYRADLILGYDDGGSTFRARDGATSGVRWETRFRWTPTNRARFGVGVGERYFGEVYWLDGRYRHKRWTFRAEYRVSIENAATSLQQEDVVLQRDLFGGRIDDPFQSGAFLPGTVTTPTLNDETFLRERFLLQAAYARGRNNASVRWFVTRREYDQSDVETRDSQVFASFSRRLSPRLTGSAILNLWEHGEDNVGSADYVQDALDLRLSYQLGRRTRIGARVGRLNRDADASDASFSENRVSMDFTFQL